MKAIKRHNFIKQIRKFSFTKSATDSQNYFISKQEVDHLFNQGAQFELGVLCQPFTQIRFHEVLDKSDDCFTFYYKKTDPSQNEPQEVLDPELKAKAVQALKNNMENLLYTPINSYTNSLGFRNFFDFSIELDKQQVFEYNKMIKLLPFRIDGDSSQINQSFRKFDALIFEGGLKGIEHFPYEPLDPDEYPKHYESDGTPKTLPRVRTPSKLHKNYQRAIKELMNINSEGHYLPAWFFCLSFSFLPLAFGSPDLTWDSYDRPVYVLHPVRIVDCDPLLKPSKRNSLRDMVEAEYKKYDKEVTIYHSNHIGFRPCNLASDPEFMSQFDVVCNSSLTDYTSPVKFRPDVERTPQDGVNFHPDSMDPEFADLIEHREHPIYAGQSYFKNFFRYEDINKYEDFDLVFETQMMYSKFFMSLVMRNKYDTSQLPSDSSDSEQSSEEKKSFEEAYKQYASLVRDLYPDIKKQMVQECLDFEFEQDLEKAKSQEIEAQSQSAEASPLDSISSMAYINQAINYYNLTLIWK